MLRRGRVTELRSCDGTVGEDMKVIVCVCVCGGGGGGVVYFFFFNDTATTEIYTLSLHDALPI